MMREQPNKEDITITKIYVLNIRRPKCIKQTLAEPEAKIDSNTVMDFNTLHAVMDTTSRQKINEEMRP